MLMTTALTHLILKIALVVVEGKSNYRGSPTYMVFTSADPTTASFGLCMGKLGIFALVEHLLQILCKMFFSSPKIDPKSV